MQLPPLLLQEGHLKDPFHPALDPIASLDDSNDFINFINLLLLQLQQLKHSATLSIPSTLWQMDLPMGLAIHDLATHNKSCLSGPCVIHGQSGQSFEDCSLLQNTLPVATAHGKLKSITDRVCQTAASTRQ